MKKNYLLALPLAATLIVPAAAQQTGSADSTQQPAQTQSQSTPQDSSIGNRQPLQPDTREGFWGKLNPFARKKYVRRQMDPVRNRVNELDELTAQNSKMLADVDSRATEGIRMASLKANEADQRALAAGQRADQAFTTASTAQQQIQTVEQHIDKLDQFQPLQTTEIRFRPGQTTLSKRAKEALDEVAAPVKQQRGVVVEVQGFASGRGQSAIAQSQKMADAVVRYLVLEHNVPLNKIYVAALGNAPQVDENGKTKRTSGGRVEIALLTNGIDELAAAQSGTHNLNGQQSFSQPQGAVNGQTTPSNTPQPNTQQPPVQQPR